MKRTKHLLAGIAVTAFFLVVPTSQAYLMTWESNSFDSGAGNWTLEQNNFANGNNVGWRNSSLAGGTAGEVGGTFTRHTAEAFFARYLDYTIDLNHEMWFRGIVSGTNTTLNANHSMWLGYFNTADLNLRVGWRTREPSGDPITSPVRSRAQVGSTRADTGTMIQGQSYSYEVHWTPSGLGDYQGVLSGEVAGTSFSFAYSGLATDTYDAFGLFWDESGDEPFRTMDVYYDNIEYLVSEIPEPSALWLGSLGLAALGMVQRLRAVRRK